MSMLPAAKPRLPEPAQQNRLLASYGRLRGRCLRPHKQALMDGVLPELEVTLPPQGMIDPAMLFPRQKEYWLEIGFGGGEHLAHQAASYPHVGIIGCEPFINGVAGLLSHIEKNTLDNIRLHTHDARPLLEKLPDGSLSRVFILYPDPWPKARHNKRRLVSKPLLDELARAMKPGAQLRLATDDSEYVTWMMERLLAHADFNWEAKRCADWLSPWHDWISTRYEQKALKAGRVPTYLSFTRRSPL